MAALSRKMLHAVAITLLTAGFTSKVAHAQISLAICDSGFTWMNNARAQSPCQVAAYLISPCLPDPTNAVVYALSEASPGQDYYLPPGPTGLGATPCTCNTVLYSMISACGLCQDQTYVSWTQWETSCSTVFTAQFPQAIPQGVSVPSWGFLDVTKTGNNFSVNAAEAEHAKNNPDFVAASSGSSAVPITHSTVDGGFTSSPAGGFSLTDAPATATNGFGISVSSGSPTQTPGTGTNGTSKKNSNVGAIVGGVVGGVGGAIIIAAALFFFLRRRNTATAVPPGTMPPSQAVYAPVAPGTPDPEKLAGGSGTGAVPLAPPPVPQGPYQPTTYDSTPVAPPPMVLYNPDDPATFPDAQNPFSPISTPSSSIANNVTPSPPPPSATNSGYVPTIY